MRFVSTCVLSFLVMAGFCFAVAPIASTSWNPEAAGCLYFTCPSSASQELTRICPGGITYLVDKGTFEKGMGCIYAGYCEKDAAGCNCCANQQTAPAVPPSQQPVLPSSVSVSAGQALWDDYGNLTLLALVLVAVVYIGAKDLAKAREQRE